DENIAGRARRSHGLLGRLKMRRARGKVCANRCGVLLQARLVAILPAANQREPPAEQRLRPSLVAKLVKFVSTDILVADPGRPQVQATHDLARQPDGVVVPASGPGDTSRWRGPRRITTPGIVCGALEVLRVFVERRIGDGAAVLNTPADEVGKH